MSKIKPELAEILGLLCAEGCHVVYNYKYKRKFPGPDGLEYKIGNSERIEFYNKDQKLIDRYRELLKKEFNYSSKLTKHGKINIGQRSIISKILYQTEIGHMKWNVPKAIKYSSNHVKVCFIRGYFDGDGTSSGCIRFFSCNITGLAQVSELLKDLEIKHTLKGPYFREGKKPSYVIQVSRKEEERFLNVIQPISKRPGTRG